MTRKPQARRARLYGRRPALVLLNGLAEQAETWFPNHPCWRRSFDVHMPDFLLYEGQALQRRIAQGLPISVDYLVDQLHLYLEAFAQAPPYHVVASSLGGKIAVEYAARYPDNVARMVLICPSGLGDLERLPIVEGMRSSDVRGLVESVFFDARQVEPGLLAYYERQFTNRRWRRGLLRTIRGTMEHSVRGRLAQVAQPTLLIAGRDDRIVNPAHAKAAARELPDGRCLLLPECGHAPQLEKPAQVNRLVVRFLTARRPVRGGAPRRGRRSCPSVSSST